MLCFIVDVPGRTFRVSCMGRFQIVLDPGSLIYVKSLMEGVPREVGLGSRTGQRIEGRDMGLAAATDGPKWVLGA